MTDVTPENVAPDTEAEGWDDSMTYPEFPGNPHNHRFTISFDGRGPMVVVRGNTAAEIIAGFQELEEAAAGAAMGNSWASIKAAAAVASGLGATPVPNAAPAAVPGMPQTMPVPATPPPFGPNVSVPGAPGFQGNPGFPPAGMPPAGGQAQGNRGPKPRPMDWPQVFKIDVPFAAKDQFKAFREQYKDAFKGKLQWAGGGNYWVHGEVAQYFAQYNPVPA